MHKKIDTYTDILAEIFGAVENNLRAIPLIERIKNTPQAEINKMLENGAKRAIINIDRAVESVSGLLIGDKTDYKLDLGGFKKEMVSNTEQVVKTLKNERRLKDIVKATQRGIENMPRVRTESGRMWGYKEYMEMRVRTDLAHELGEMQISVGGEVGRVFYICNVFQDSADDHAPFQGKYYYDTRYKEFGYDAETIKKIEDGIRRLKIMPLQHVRDNKPYLTTRPNCRHTFTPVSIEQALNVSPKKMVEDLKITTGTYRDKNYQATQQLRLMERNIRNYKYNVKIYDEGIKNATDPRVRDEFVELKNKEYAKYRKWQVARKKHVEKYDNLEIDYRRETRSKILNDMGVKYNYKELLDEL